MDVVCDPNCKDPCPSNCDNTCNACKDGYHTRSDTPNKCFANVPCKDPNCSTCNPTTGL